jgi:hypothetical protein
MMEGQEGGEEGGNGMMMEVFEIEIDMVEGSEEESVVTSGTVPDSGATEAEGAIPLILWDDKLMRPDHDRHGHPHGDHPHYRDHDHHHRPHGHGHGHGMQFEDMEDDEGITLYKIFVHVLTPIVIGVGAGFLFSMIGMLIGHVIVLAWHKVRGTKMEGCYKRREAKEVGVIGQEEAEKGLLEDQEEDVEEYTDAPPDYDGGVEAVGGVKQ